MDRILNYLADKTPMLIAGGLQVLTDGAAFADGLVKILLPSIGSGGITVLALSLGQLVVTPFSVLNVQIGDHLP